MENIKKLDLGKNSIIIFLVILTLYPFFFMIMTSFKDYSQFIHFFWQPVLPLHWKNYLEAWKQIAPYVLNSFIVTGVSVAGVLLFSSFSAYVFARYKFPGSNFLFFAILALIMVPSVLTIIPAFMWIMKLGLLDTRWALILPYIAGGQVFTIFVFRTFFASIPSELLEAARIDGASEIVIFSKIVLPLSKPIIGTLAIINTINFYNDYLWPLLVIYEDKLKTIPIGLMFFRGQYASNYGAQMAGYALASLPLFVLFLFTMKQFVRGLMSGAIKM